MSTATRTRNYESIALVAADGYRLAARRYDAHGSRAGHLVVAGATGVPQRFYHRFARYAAQQGFATLTLDYRGVGESKPIDLRGFQADFLDWAGLDLAAAVDKMADDTVPLFLVGHSFGGQALGLLPNSQRIEGFYTFGTGAGWHGWMPFLESLRVRLLWKVVLPLLTGWKGYAPMSMIGVGEDLPLGVYRQWRHWCGFPHYFFDDPQMSEVAEQFARVRTPIAAANALDDLWAQPRSRDAFVRAYCNAPIERIDLHSDDWPGGLGHMGYFRRKSQPLWDDVLAWFKRR